MDAEPTVGNRDLFRFMHNNGISYSTEISKQRSRRWWLRVGVHQYGPFRSRKAAQRNQETIVFALHQARYEQHKTETGAARF